MPASQAKKKKSKQATASTAEFRRFLDLPIELRNAIWDLHRETQPLIRHCFSVSKTSTRLYLALDYRGNRVVDVLAKRNGPQNPLPYLTKIGFTGTVRVQTTSLDPDNPVVMGHKGTRKVVPAAIYADLKRDIFCFDWHDERAELEHEWFCFLRNPIHRLEQRALPDDHWIFRVQKLALGRQGADSRGSAWDYRILRRMRALRKVWLIHTLYYHDDLDWEEWGPQTNVVLRRLSESKGFVEVWELCDRDRKKLLQYDGDMEKSIREHLENNSISADVSIALDKVMYWW
ncbi:hypothetical protein F5Y04DRAFT_99997 [Hypomontagnella monticulosa]|nr:hypothetical protein F5Y04DRAFT_99997 [Hypomontagnella monticulosa]